MRIELHVINDQYGREFNRIIRFNKQNFINVMNEGKLEGYIDKMIEDIDYTINLENPLKIIKSESREILSSFDLKLLLDHEQRLISTFLQECENWRSHNYDLNYDFCKIKALAKEMETEKISCNFSLKTDKPVPYLFFFLSLKNPPSLKEMNLDDAIKYVASVERTLFFKKGTSSISVNLGGNFEKDTKDGADWWKE